MDGKKSITFKKLILLFAAVILPFLLLGPFLIYQNRIAARGRTFSQIQNKTDMTADALTDTMEQLQHTAAQMAEQTNLKKLGIKAYRMSPYEAAQSILQLQEQQTSIRNANPYIEKFIIYYLHRLQAYNSKESGVPSFFTFTREEYEGLAHGHNSYDFLAVHDRQLTEIILPSSGAEFMIRVDLSSEAVAALLENAFLEYDDYYYLLDVFGGSWQLTNLPKEALSGPAEGADEISIDGVRYYGFSAGLPYGDGRLCFFFSKDQLFQDSEAYQRLYLCFGLIVFAACSLFLLGSYSLIHKPIQTLVNAFQHINKQDYSIRISGNPKSDFDYLYQEFNHMVKELETLIEKNYQQQLLLSKAELKQLQAQINPHFLYNSFFLLRRMIEDELYEEAGEMADTLGLYFQYITRNSQDYMPLGKEYHHAMLYCEIQRLRFGDRILIETDPVPEKYSQTLVPKLIIQPILENAFNYGLRNKVEEGVLRVRVEEDAACLVISVEDNGDELTKEGLERIQRRLKETAEGNVRREMSGILNIQRRLGIYFKEQTPPSMNRTEGGEYLQASRSPLGGLCMRLYLPLPAAEEKERGSLYD